MSAVLITESTFPVSGLTPPPRSLASSNLLLWFLRFWYPMALSGYLCPRGWWVPVVYEQLVSPLALLHLPVGPMEGWKKGTRPRSDRIIRMEQSAVHASSFWTATMIVWEQTMNQTHTNTMPIHQPAAHTQSARKISAHPLLSQDPCSLSPIVTLAHTKLH